MDLGKHYLALTVKDISASKAFYEKLGFRQDDRWGSEEEKWITMNNGSTTIGLFEGMFPKNILTFNPGNAREIYEALSTEEVEIAMEANIDKADGPCHFSVIDPDGNPILFDQH